MAYSFTQEEINTCRMSRILLGPCSNQFRDVLRYRVPPADFSRVIGHYIKNLPSLTSVLPRISQYSGDYSDMDISLLYKFLRNICNLQPHKTGWGNKPDDNDISLSASIERIREVRNQIVHLGGMHLSQEVFNEYLSQIKKAVSSIDDYLAKEHKYVNDVNSLINDSMEIEERNFKKLKKQVARDLEDLRELIHPINESEADRIQILPFKPNDTMEVDSIYVPMPIIDEYDKSDIQRVQRIKEESIFYVKQGKRPARFVFMLGEAGYGKTVQCQRITKAWCEAWKDETTDEEYEPPRSDLSKCLKHFDLLIFIKMRDVSNKHVNLIDMVNDVYSRYHLSEENLTEIKRVLKDGYLQTLVLLDGLDEWNLSNENMKNLLDQCLPNCRDLPKCTILISMRSWKFMEVEKICRPNVDRVVRLNGLDDDGVKDLTAKMLHNYFKNEPNVDNLQEKHEQVQRKLSSATADLKSLMNIPLLAVFYILTSYEEVETGYSLTTFYLSILEALFKRSSRMEQSEQVGEVLLIWRVASMMQAYLAHQSRQILALLRFISGSKVHSLQKYPKVTQYLQQLCRLGQVAFDSLTSDNSNLVFSEEELDKLLDKKSLDLFLKVGLVIKSGASGKFHENNVRISFLHKTIQEFLASLYLIYGRRQTDIKELGLTILKNVDKALEFSPSLIFLAGLSPAVGCTVSGRIKDLTYKDEDILKYRHHFHPRSYQKVFNLYNLQLRCYREARGFKSIKDFIKEDGRNLKFSFSDIIVLNSDSDTQIIRESAEVLTYHANDIISLNMVCISDDDRTGISNAELNKFLDESQSIKSLYIEGCVNGNCRMFYYHGRTISNLSTFGLRNVALSDNILTDIFTKESSIRGMQAVGLLYLKSAEVPVDFQYRIPSIHWKSTAKSGFRRKVLYKRTSGNSDENSVTNWEQKPPILKKVLESLPNFQKLTLIHITYMEADDDRQTLLQLIPKLNQLNYIAYSGSSTFQEPNFAYDAAVISKISELRMLKKIRIHYVSLTENIPNFRNLSKLEEISFELFKVRSADDWKTFFESVSTTLKRIFLYDTDIPQEVEEHLKNYREVLIEKSESI